MSLVRFECPKCGSWAEALNRLGRTVIEHPCPKTGIRPKTIQFVPQAKEMVA